MTGNVYEWVWDPYDDSYYTAAPVTDPEGGSPATDGGWRGGGFNCGPTNDCRVTHRTGAVKYGRWSNVGFRLGRTIP